MCGQWKLDLPLSTKVQVVNHIQPKHSSDTGLAYSPSASLSDGSKYNLGSGFPARDYYPHSTWTVFSSHFSSQTTE